MWNFLQILHCTVCLLCIHDGLPVSAMLTLPEEMLERVEQMEPQLGPASEFTLKEDKIERDVEQALGQLTDAAIASSDGTNLYLLHRGSRVWDENTFDDQHRFKAAAEGPIKEPIIAEISGGKIKQQFGENLLYLPHSITLDDNGNTWLTDAAAHQVLKFEPGNFTQPQLVLGEKLVSGSDDKHFCQPTDVAVASNGHFFVSDGYCNSRIMKFDENGKLLKQWSRAVGDELEYELKLPHMLTLVESMDLICVANRNAWQMLCFSAGLKDSNKTGELTVELNEPGPVYAVAYDKLLSKLIIAYRRVPGLKHAVLDVYDPSIDEVVETVSGNAHLNEAHALATCPVQKSDTSSCVVVISDAAPSQLERVWFYETTLLPSQEDDFPPDAAIDPLIFYGDTR